jgi:hypothetical protein
LLNMAAATAAQNVHQVEAASAKLPNAA